MKSEPVDVVIESTRKTADGQGGAAVAKIGACLHVCGGCGGKMSPSSSVSSLSSQLTDNLPGQVCLGSTVSQCLVSLQ